MPFIQDETQHFPLYEKLSGQLTLRQSKLGMSTIATDTHHTQTHNTEVSHIVSSNDKVETFGNKIIIHYTHEKRFQSFKRDMHRLYEDIFKNSPAMDVKLIVGNRNRRNATHQLIRKRPRKSLLQNKPLKSMCLSTLEAEKVSLVTTLCFLFHRKTKES